MKYLVIYSSTQTVLGARKDLYGKLQPNEHSIYITKFKAFDSETEAVLFCKQKNGYVVKALDLVLEKDEDQDL